MDPSRRPALELDNSFVRDLAGLYEPWHSAPTPQPQLLALDEDLANDLGIDPAWLRTPAGVAALLGHELPADATPVAQAYAGHQFGGYSPRLGDGRALLLGEIVGPDGRRRDLHLKGSGRTPFSRGGDGKAAVGPMLRELIVGSAMHALGIPTTRALAVIATGETVRRDTPLPGAVLVRVAASHLRVGSFQYASAQDDPTLLRRLADHAIARHHPHAATAPNPYLALYEAVLDAQAELIARWMHVGFIHGVMNTDNMTISGETIDYGPCAFLDAFDPTTVFSSIDHQGRYAFGSQPAIAQWNLARFAESMLDLFDPVPDAAVELATELLQSFPARYDRAWHAGMCAKLGLSDDDASDASLIDDLLRLMHEHRADHTATYRALAMARRGDESSAAALLGATDASAAWLARWSARLGGASADHRAIADAMDAVNPVHIPRNHLVESALDAATAGDLTPLRDLLEVLATPYDTRPGLERYAAAAPADAAPYRTFCGT